MKRIPLLMLVFLAATWGAAEDDISAQRYFKSSKTKQVLAAPRRGFEMLFIPVRAASNYAERVNLPVRLRDFFYNEAYTAAVFPAFSFGGELGGLAFGADAFHKNLFQRAKILRGGFLIRERDALQTKAAYEDPAIGDGDWRWALKADYRRDDNQEIYSRGEHLGIFTTPDDKGSFELKRFNGMVELAHQWDHLETGLYGSGTRGHAEEGDGGGVPPPTTLPGFDQVVHLGGAGALFRWDRRDQPERSSLGTLLEARGGMVNSPDRTDAGERYRFAEYHAQALQFFTLFKPRRVLVLRAALDRVDPVDGEIPFYELPMLDKNHMARNFPRGRFRDQGALAFNAEYRYPIWVSWDAYLFLDAGQTFGPYREIQSTSFRFSEGFGIRFGNADRMLFNVVLGFGREETQLGIDFSQVF